MRDPVTLEQLLASEQRLLLSVIASLVVHAALLTMDIGMWWGVTGAAPHPHGASLRPALEARLTRTIVRHDRPARAAPPAMSSSPAIPLPVPVYYPASALSVQPVPISEIPDEIESEQGRMVMRLFLDAAGMVAKIEAVESSFDPVATRTLLQRFGRARYSPGMIDGLPVASQLSLEIVASKSQDPGSSHVSDGAARGAR